MQVDPVAAGDSAGRRRAGQFEFDDLTLTTFAILGPIEHLVFWYRSGEKPTPAAIADKLVVLALHRLKSFE